MIPVNPLTRQNATTDLHQLRVEGHAIGRQPKIVILTAKALDLHNELIRVTASQVLMLDVPKQETRETPPELVEQQRRWAEDRFKELDRPRTE